MSSDATVNAALLNLCAQLQGGDTRPTASEGAPAPANAGGCAQVTTQPGTSVAAPSTAADARPSAVVGETARPPSDYEWLRNALASVEAPEKRLKQLLLSTESDATEGSREPSEQEERVEALAEMAEMVEDVNWAAEFALMHGPQRLLQALRRERAAHSLPPTSAVDTGAHLEAAERRNAAKGGSPPATHDSIPSSAVPLFTQFAMVIAHSAQLNEQVQVAYQAARWEDILLPFLGDCIEAVQSLVRLISDGVAVDKRGDGAEAASTATTATSLMSLLGALLHACSCLCRDCAPNTIVFIQSNGLAVLVEVLRLTQALLESLFVNGAICGRMPVAVTSIASDTATEEEVDDIFAPLLRVAHKVAARVFFFVAYLASTGVSSEEIIRLTCQHAESQISDEALQKSAARALLSLLEKSPQSMKEFVHTLMPRRMKEWRTHLQREEGVGVTEDERRQLVDAIDRMS
ncbi:hypothetical protein LSCM1_01534 [Leishmania martiniquensis]|uniref:Uncharacterized protein n=1 Tax=Leishmania martiniquensis TaxID=1580590 RepID=A0A836H5Q7_9TRYP|nr:hypothetical protein LSCM1_01534 [Leishmania martiniquensis]